MLLCLFGDLKMEKHPALSCNACLEAVQTDILWEQMNAQSPPGKMLSAPLGKKFLTLLLSIKGKEKPFAVPLLSAATWSLSLSVPKCHGPTKILLFNQVTSSNWTERRNQFCKPFLFLFPKLFSSEFAPARKAFNQHFVVYAVLSPALQQSDRCQELCTELRGSYFDIQSNKQNKLYTCDLTQKFSRVWWKAQISIARQEGLHQKLK